MGKSVQVDTVDQDGFEGLVFMNEEKEQTFVSWQLAEFFAAHRPGGIRITGITGEKGTPRAAAYNFEDSVKTNGEARAYLQRVLRSRIQIGSAEEGIRVHVPGARVQVAGYDEPLELNLQAFVDSPADVPLAVDMLASSLARVVARGVYARTKSKAAPETGDVADIESVGS